MLAEGKEENCLPQEAGLSPEIQEGELQPPACRVCRVPFQQGKHCEPGLEEGEEYFFVLITPTDPNHFVSMSDIKRVVARSGTAASWRAQSGPKVATDNFCKSSLAGPPLISCMLTHGFEALESRLNTLDLLAIDTSRLYKAGNSKNAQAFIGFLKGEPCHPEESRKRRRVDWESDEELSPFGS